MKAVGSVILAIFVLGLMSCANDKKQTNSKSSQSLQKSSVISETTNTKVSEKGSSGTSMSQEQLTKAETIIAAISQDVIDAVDAKKVFKSHCALCHGFKGNMKINGAKDLTISKISLEEAVAQVYFGKGLMSPYKGTLKDEEILAVCKYIEKEIRN